MWSAASGKSVSDAPKMIKFVPFDPATKMSEATVDEPGDGTQRIEGKPYGRIAEEINVSYKTVVNVSSQLKQKLDARNLPELIRTAVQLLSATS